jgi:hypothetical protein
MPATKEEPLPDLKSDDRPIWVAWRLSNLRWYPVRKVVSPHASAGDRKVAPRGPQMIGGTVCANVSLVGEPTLAATLVSL